MTDRSCAVCGASVARSASGPPRTYCSDPCRREIRRRQYAANPRPRVPRPSVAERMASKVSRAASGCLEWTGSTSPQGYGQIWHEDRLQLSHRVAWSLAHGAIPDGAVVCHHCDNPRCVNVAHLFVGTQAENVRDMVAKGRARGPVKIPDRDVGEIRSRYRTFTIPGRAGTFSNAQDLASEFGISKGHVQKLASNQYRKAIA